MVNFEAPAGFGAPRSRGARPTPSSGREPLAGDLPRVATQEIRAHTKHHRLYKQPGPLRTPRAASQRARGTRRSRALTTEASSHETRREIEDALKGGNSALHRRHQLPRARDRHGRRRSGVDGGVAGCCGPRSPAHRAAPATRWGTASRGRIYPKHRSDLLEAAVVARKRCAPVPSRRFSLPRNPAGRAWRNRSSPWSSLRPVEDRPSSRRSSAAGPTTGSSLAGNSSRGPRDAWRVAIRRRIFRRAPSAGATGTASETVIEARRRGAKQLAILSGGTIPDRGLYAVHLGPEGPRDRRARRRDGARERGPGETLTLGASTWRIVEITRDRVIVAGRTRRNRKASVLARRRAGSPPRAWAGPRSISARDLLER